MTGRPPATCHVQSLSRAELIIGSVKGSFLRRMHVRPRTDTFMPDPGDPFLRGLVLEDWRMTSVLQNCHVALDEWIDLPWSMPETQRYQVQAELWTGGGRARSKCRPRRRRW